jgi:hypothetical protein
VQPSWFTCRQHELIHWYVFVTSYCKLKSKSTILHDWNFCFSYCFIGNCLQAY